MTALYTEIPGKIHVETARKIARFLTHTRPATKPCVEWHYETEYDNTYHFAVCLTIADDAELVIEFRAGPDAAFAFVDGIGHQSWNPGNMRTWDQTGDIPLQFNAEAVSDL